MATSSTSNTVGTLSSPGLGSGLDVSSIVSQLVALEKKPISQIDSDVSKMQSKLSSWGQIKSALSSLRDAASSLNLPTTWTPTSAKSADTSVVTATTTSSTSPGTYNITVANLAASQSVATARFGSSSAAVGQGSITIELGTWNADQTSFTSSGATPVTISIGAGEDSLTAIRDKINQAGAGVTASVVTDTTGSRLVLNGSTGAANGFRVSVSDSDGNDTDATGLSALAYDPPNSGTSMTLAQAALDAKATVNGLEVTSPSNTINSIEGVTFTLGKPTNTAIAVSVSRDTEAMEKSIRSFADAYSKLISLVRDQTKYDESTKTGATLQGDTSAVSLQWQFRTLVGGSSGASSAYQTLSQIGLTVQKDGSLGVDSAKLQDALKNNLGEVKKLFANSDASDSSKDGIAQRFRALGDQVLGVDGVVGTRTAGIQSAIDRAKDRKADLEDRATLYEARLRAQYTALDTNLSKLNSLSAYVTQQIQLLNNTKR